MLKDKKQCPNIWKENPKRSNGHIYNFRESKIKKSQKTNLNQNPKGVLLFFPNKSPQIKSYILLKINFQEDIFIVAMGSKDINKFNPHQQVDLIEYLIKIIEIKIHQIWSV